ncbi:hypothetical protein [Terriglobus sp. TAA 43]|uniref:DUF6932 family protein n=1 Tax=Terriglobus sp. TAA 43 TaxID=278961 RepID=UPI00068DA7A6|nr:hypothetical protein [Terriglobus sp. TAA 43]
MGTNPLPAAGNEETIPPFTSSGVLPPYIGGNPTIPANMSPYRVTLLEVVQRFSHSSERRTILAGFLAHRAHLIGIGITGVQWLDGSFLEDIENTEERSPGDIDVVSFIVRPPAYQADNDAWNTFWMGHSTAFDPEQAKVSYQTDAYFVDVMWGPAYVIKQTAYWFGLFSHKRSTGLWKGMLEVVLDSQQDDAAASQLLATFG